MRHSLLDNLVLFASISITVMYQMISDGLLKTRNETFEINVIVQLCYTTTSGSHVV